jgi:hypothetical protein
MSWPRPAFSPYGRRFRAVGHYIDYGEFSGRNSGGDAKDMSKGDKFHQVAVVN